MSNDLVYLTKELESIKGQLHLLAQIVQDSNTTQGWNTTVENAIMQLDHRIETLQEGYLYHDQVLDDLSGESKSFVIDNNQKPN